MKIWKKDGFVTTIRGKGTFVKEQDNSILKGKAIFVIENLAHSMSKEKPKQLECL